MQSGHNQRESIRLAELMAALSKATDLGIGEPMEFAMTSCVLALRLGERLALNDEQLREVYYQALLRYIGCNAETSMLAGIVGDEIAFRADYARLDNSKTAEVMRLALRFVRKANEGVSAVAALGEMAHGVLAMQEFADQGINGHCEVAQKLAERFGFSGSIVLALGQLYERWDGRGIPHKLKGEEIALAVRVVTLAQDVVLFHRIGGVAAAVAVAEARKGMTYDPRLVEVFCRHAAQLCASLDDGQSWAAVIALEPTPQLYLSEEQFDNACRAIADFSDMKTTFTLNHSSGVAELAALAAQRCGLPQADQKAIWRAGMLHDIGRTAISGSIWEKPGPLSERDWEKVRLHPYYTERILGQPGLLARLGNLAGLNHERLDGSGYHRGATAPMLAPAAKILAAADVYHALTEQRPHRPAHTPEAAAAELRREALLGRLDTAAVDAVLAAADQHTGLARRQFVAGLSQREIEVLRLLARSNSIKQIAAALTISQKTADNHIQHIYTKIGVSTRAGATLFALEHNLLNDAS